MRCRDFPCQIWKLVSSVMLLMALVKKRLPVFTGIYTCRDEETLAGITQRKKGKLCLFTMLLVWWSVLFRAPKDRLCISSPMEQHVSLHLQALVCLLDGDGFLMLSVLFFI